DLGIRAQHARRGRRDQNALRREASRRDGRHGEVREAAGRRRLRQSLGEGARAPRRRGRRRELHPRDVEVSRQELRTRSENDLFDLAMSDVSTAFIRSMQADGYNVTLDKYLAMRLFGIDVDFVRTMNSLK